jgi:hypothetical protein
MISSASPVSLRTRSMKPVPLPACRQASVAIRRVRFSRRPASLPAQTASASSARSIAASLSRPLADKPSPSRTMREKASTTRK